MSRIYFHTKTGEAEIYGMERAYMGNILNHLAWSLIETNDNAIDKEDNVITYMGEDAEPEDHDMDGDENFNY